MHESGRERETEYSVSNLKTDDQCFYYYPLDIKKKQKIYFYLLLFY
jgi:hypothetical protein